MSMIDKLQQLENDMRRQSETFVDEGKEEKDIVTREWYGVWSKVLNKWSKTLLDAIRELDGPRVGKKCLKDSRT